MKIKQNLKRLAIAAMVGLISVTLFFKEVVMRSEGYPTWAGVRNFLFRDGQARIDFPKGFQPTSVSCDDEHGGISIEESSVVVRLGHTRCLMMVEGRLDDDQLVRFKFLVTKFNAWNRNVYIGKQLSSGEIEFRLFENGVEKPAEVQQEVIHALPGEDR